MFSHCLFGVFEERHKCWLEVIKFVEHQQVPTIQKQTTTKELVILIYTLVFEKPSCLLPPFLTSFQHVPVTVGGNKLVDMLVLGWDVGCLRRNSKPKVAEHAMKSYLPLALCILQTPLASLVVNNLCLSSIFFRCEPTRSPRNTNSDRFNSVSFLFDILSLCTRKIKSRFLTSLIAFGIFQLTCFSIRILPDLKSKLQFADFNSRYADRPTSRAFRSEPQDQRARWLLLKSCRLNPPCDMYRAFC